jgi:hypothetical protein
VVAAVALVGCTGGQSDPTEYGSINDQNEGYYGNLMFGCTGVEANDDGEYVDVKLEDPDFCTCIFRGMKETVPFADAQEFDEQQADAEEGTDITIPSNINTVRTTCAEDDGAYS